MPEADADSGAAPLVLHGYWRSTATWRVRIALALKGLEWRTAVQDLLRGDQRALGYLAINPQGLVPALAIGGGTVLTQSMAICEYIDEAWPEPPLLPADPLGRARVRAFAQAIACDIHPVQNLRVLKMLKARGLDNAAAQGWAAEVIESGLAACAQMIAGIAGPYCFGDQVTLADILLVPQLGNARRFGAAHDFPRLLQIEENCRRLPAFIAADPAQQPGAQ